jgi:hypothetical protein
MPELFELTIPIASNEYTTVPKKSGHLDTGATMGGVSVEIEFIWE